MEKHREIENENKRCEKDDDHQFLVKHLRRSFIVSGIFQIPYLLLLFVFFNLALITTMDILYFPPILDFTLKNYYIWNMIFIILTGILILQFIVGLLLKLWIKKEPKKMLRPIIYFVSCVQLLFLPIGTYYGLYELQLAKNLFKSISGRENQEIINEKSEFVKSPESETISTEEINKKIGKIFIGVGVHWLGLLLFFILLTFYFTTVMLDMTYPYLTMSILLQARAFFGIMVGISMAELLFGRLYSRIPESKLKVVAFWIFWVWSLILIPVGTSASLLLKKIKKQRQRLQSISK